MARSDFVHLHTHTEYSMLTALPATRNFSPRWHVKGCLRSR